MNAISNIPFWGQSWELVITYQSEDGLRDETVSASLWEPEALRITFEVLQSTVPSPWWFADIVIYNLNVPKMRNIVLNAVSVILKAGFQTGPAFSSIIWAGPVLQVLLDQEQVVDTRATLHCVANPFVMEDIQAFSLGAFASQAQLVAKMAEQIGLPPISEKAGTLSSYAQNALNLKQYPRGNTVFGKTGKYLAQIASDQFMTTFRDGAQAYMTEYSTGKTTPPADFTYAPPNPPNTTSTLPPDVTQTLIGLPRQTPQGVIFTVLLDPRLKVQLPLQVAQLVGTAFSQLQREIGGAIIPPINNLTFFVGQVRHIGDSRGNDWYTEVTGFNTTYGSNLLAGIFQASSAGVS